MLNLSGVQELHIFSKTFVEVVSISRISFMTVGVV